MRKQNESEVKTVKPGRNHPRSKLNKDPNLSAGKRSDNAIEHQPKKEKRPAEPLVIEKTP